MSNTTLFIPKKIKVGYQNRSDTYTKMLAYVIYYDEKNKLRKETSWENWRDNKIESNDYDNIPTSSFVLNKKVGDYRSDWNHRKAYVRIYDPRNFEFEITVENLLYILENSTSTVGKGLEGEFVYSWDGKDLVLLPCSAPEYKDLQELNSKRFNANFKAKDLKVGATYLFKDNKNYVYMGYYKKINYDYCYSYNNFKYNPISKSKLHWFYSLDRENFKTFSSLSKEIVGVIDENVIQEYASYYEKLSNNKEFSPIDETKTKIIDLTLEEFNDILNKNYLWGKYNVICNINGELQLYYFERNYPNREMFFNYEDRKNNYYNYKRYKLDQLHKTFKPVKVEYYLENGNLYTTRYS